MILKNITGQKIMDNMHSLDQVYQFFIKYYKSTQSTIFKIYFKIKVNPTHIDDFILKI